jgi:hypothetical protein
MKEGVWENIAQQEDDTRNQSGAQGSPDDEVQERVSVSWKLLMRRERGGAGFLL